MSYEQRFRFSRFKCRLSAAGRKGKIKNLHDFSSVVLFAANASSPCRVRARLELGRATTLPGPRPANHNCMSFILCQHATLKFELNMRTTSEVQTCKISFSVFNAHGGILQPSRLYELLQSFIVAQSSHKHLFVLNNCLCAAVEQNGRIYKRLWRVLGRPLERCSRSFVIETITSN